MNERQYKKLCKKSAEIIGFDKCCNDDDDGIWHFIKWDHYWGEHDSEEAFDYLVSVFHGNVNTEELGNSEWGLEWKPDNELTKATPANVFAWARKQEWK